MWEMGVIFLSDREFYEAPEDEFYDEPEEEVIYDKKRGRERIRGRWRVFDSSNDEDQLGRNVGSASYINEVWPDEEYKLRLDGEGARNDWEWLLKVKESIADLVEKREQVSSKLITYIARREWGELHQPVTHKLRRCWRRGWIRRWHGTHPKSKYTRQSRKIFYLLEEIPDEKYGTDRIRY